MIRKGRTWICILLAAVMLCLSAGTAMPVGAVAQAAEVSVEKTEKTVEETTEAREETTALREKKVEETTDGRVEDVEETTTVREETVQETTEAREETTAVREKEVEETTEAWVEDVEETTTAGREKDVEEQTTAVSLEKLKEKYATEDGMPVYPETRPLLEELFKDRKIGLMAASSANGVAGINVKWEIYNTGMDAWWPVSNGSVERDSNWSSFTTNQISDLKPGDVVLWEYGGMWVGHIAIVTQVAYDGSYYYTADGNTGSATGISLIRRTDTLRSGAASDKILVWRNRKHGPAIASSAEQFASRIIKNYDMTLKSTYGSVNWCYAFVVEALLQVNAGYLRLEKERKENQQVAGAVYGVYEEDKSTVAGWFVMTPSGAGRAADRIRVSAVKDYTDETSSYSAFTDKGKLATDVKTSSDTYSFGRLDPGETYWYCSTGNSVMELKADTTYYVKEILTPISQKYKMDPEWHSVRTGASGTEDGDAVSLLLEDELVEEKPGYLKMVKEKIGSNLTSGAVYNVYKKDKQTLAGRFVLTGSGEGRVVKRLTSSAITSYEDATDSYTDDNDVGKLGRSIVADGETYPFGRSTPGGNVWYCATGSSAMELEKGTYYIREFLTPINQKYELDESFYKVVIVPEQTETVTLKDEISSGIRLTKLSEPEEAAEQFTLRGALYNLYQNYENGEYSGYAGISFIVKDGSGTGYQAFRTTDKTEAEKHKYYIDRGSVFYYTDWESKEVVLDEEAVFYVKEIVGPDTGRYEITQPAKKKVVAKAGETCMIYGSDVVKKGTVKLEKTSVPASAAGKAGYDLKGALYILSKREDHTGYAGVSFITDEKGTGYVAERTEEQDKIPKGAYVRSVKTSSTVYYFWTEFKETEAKMDYGTYYVRERLGPENGKYEMGDVEQDPITVSPDRTVEIRGKDELIRMDRMGVLLKKADRETQSAQGDASLEGAEFTVRYFETLFTKEKEMPAKPDRTWVFQTGQDGKIEFAKEEQKISGDALFYDQDGKAAVPQGTLVVEETKAPEGYLRNTQLRIITIRIDGALRERNIFDASGKLLGTQELTEIGQSADLDLEISEAVKRGGVRFLKTDAETKTCVPKGAASLEGAEIAIYNISGKAVADKDGNRIPSADAESSVTEEHRVQTVTVQADGIAETGAEDLPFGTYVAKELKAPEGYLFNPDWQCVFEIREDGVIVDQTGFPLEEFAERGNISFTKMVQRLTGKEPLGNVLWEVINTDTGETHYLVTDPEGRFDSSVLPKDNGNDGCVRKKEDGSFELTEQTPDSAHGVWFSMGKEGNQSKSREELGAFVYGTYEFRELETDANRGCSLLVFTVEVKHTGTNRNDDPKGLFQPDEILDTAPPEKAYTDPKMTEETPVGPGSLLGYTLFWSNTRNEEAEITLYDTLSEGLEYREGSASSEPSEVLSNKDGTTTLIWKLGRQKAAAWGSIRYEVSVTEDALKECLVANDYDLQYGEEDRLDIRELKNPVPHYKMEKRRITKAPRKEGTGQYGFFRKDKVLYETRVINDGQTDLEMTVTDAFDPVAASSFDRLTIVQVEGCEELERIDERTVKIALKKGGTAVITYEASVNRKAPELLAPKETDDRDDPADGYLNTALVSDVSTEYQDAEGKTVRLTKKENAALQDQSDRANTPVQITEPPSETTVPETTIRETTTQKPAVRETKTTKASAPKTGDPENIWLWILTGFGGAGLIIMAAGRIRRKNRR